MRVDEGTLLRCLEAGGTLTEYLFGREGECVTKPVAPGQRGFDLLVPEPGPEFQSPRREATAPGLFCVWNDSITRHRHGQHHGQGQEDQDQVSTLPRPHGYEEDGNESTEPRSPEQPRDHCDTEPDREHHVNTSMVIAFTLGSYEESGETDREAHRREVGRRPPNAAG